MSKRDYRRDAKRIAEFQGRRCLLSLAMNSVKIHIDKRIKRGLFIWIDPPWQFCQDEKLIASSASYPHWKEKNYEIKHEQWCALFNPILKTSLENVIPHSDGSLDLVFSKDYRIFVLKKFLKSKTPLWYDHWYVSRKSNLV